MLCHAADACFPNHAYQVYRSSKLKCDKVSKTLLALPTKGAILVYDSGALKWLYFML
jgi:hypothetical protein